MSQSPGFPSTWGAGADTAHRVPGIGQALFPWLLLHELQLSAAQPYLLHQECWEREGQQGLGREHPWVCHSAVEGRARGCAMVLWKEAPVCHSAVEGSAHVPWCCGTGFPRVLSWPLWVRVECPPLVHQNLPTGDQSDTTGLLLFPLGFRFCK